MAKHAADIKEVVSKDSFHLESYYEKIKSWTFKSIFYDLSHDKAVALSKARARRVRGQSESPLIEEIAREMQNAISEVGGRAVVRLSTRSPKDIVLQRPDTFSYFEEEEKSLMDQNLREDVRQMIALTRAAGKAMSVTSGREAVEMFIDSQRVFDDITTACSMNPHKVLRVIVREFIPLLNELELRVFVNQGKVCAISQYYASCQVKWLHDHKTRVEQEVTRAVYQISPLLGMEDFVIDFAYDKAGKLWVVEINLPPPLAGMSMFDKHNVLDMKIIRGEAPYEFRLATIDSPQDCRQKYRMFFEAYNKRGSLPAVTNSSISQRKLRTSF